MRSRQFPTRDASLGRRSGVTARGTVAAPTLPLDDSRAPVGGVVGEFSLARPVWLQSCVLSLDGLLAPAAPAPAGSVLIAAKVARTLNSWRSSAPFTGRPAFCGGAPSVPAPPRLILRIERGERRRWLRAAGAARLI